MRYTEYGESNGSQWIRRWWWRRLQIDKILARCVRQDHDTNERLRLLEERLDAILSAVLDDLRARKVEIDQQLKD